MKKLTALFLIALLAGCAPNPADVKEVAVAKTVQLEKPSKPLSSFADYELEPVKFSKGMRVDRRKDRHLAILNEKVREKLLPLFSSWKSPGDGSRSGTLIVEPEVTYLKIVGGGARFWLGVFRGQSSINMTLRLIDGATKKVIAEPLINKNSGAWAGAWSIGRSDKNLHEYIAGIAYQYLVSNY